MQAHSFLWKTRWDNVYIFQEGLERLLRKKCREMSLRNVFLKAPPISTPGAFHWHLDEASHSGLNHEDWAQNQS